MPCYSTILMQPTPFPNSNMDYKTCHMGGGHGWASAVDRGRLNQQVTHEDSHLCLFTASLLILSLFAFSDSRNQWEWECNIAGGACETCTYIHTHIQAVEHELDKSKAVTPWRTSFLLSCSVFFVQFLKMCWKAWVEWMWAKTLAKFQIASQVFLLNRTCRVS